YKVGSSASMRPPVQVQSAGLQNMSPFCGNQFCDATKPGRLPIRALCGNKAPFGAPVVPEVYSSQAGLVDPVGTTRKEVGWRASNERQGMMASCWKSTPIICVRAGHCAWA